MKKRFNRYFYAILVVLLVYTISVGGKNAPGVISTAKVVVGNLGEATGNLIENVSEHIKQKSKGK